MHWQRMYQLDMLARQHYTYKHDPVNNDEWHSYHKDVLAGRAWADDCDSLSSTVINLMLLEGHPLEKSWFAHVDSSHSGHVDHMIALAMDDNGVMFVVGDTFGPCYPTSAMKHTLLKFCRLTNIQAWYLGSDIRQLTLI